MKFTPTRPPIHGETLASLAACLAEAGEPAYRAAQVLDWLYKKRAAAWDQMTNLPKALRTWLADTFDFDPSTLVLNRQSEDVTDKLLLELRDRSLIETVIIRAPQDGVGLDHSRKTICISTQVGCAMGCRFCASGLAGLKRDLSAGEIVHQLIQVCRREDVRTPRARTELASFDNIVVMGMGEPLHNYDNLLRALTIVNAAWGLGVGARRITISTSGLVPQIRRLAGEPVGFRLAVSLHGATNEVREQIMPVNRRWPLEQLRPPSGPLPKNTAAWSRSSSSSSRASTTPSTRPRNSATSRATSTPTSISSPTTPSKACPGAGRASRASRNS